MRLLVLAATMALVLPPLGLAAQPSTAPASPEPTPRGLYVPDCANPAWGIPDEVDVYVRRRDWDRALHVYAAAGDAQSACARLFRDNARGQVNMLGTAARGYARAADLAVRLGRYASARSYAEKSNEVYAMMLKSPAFDSNGASRNGVMAEMRVNSDIIANRIRGSAVPGI